MNKFYYHYQFFAFLVIDPFHLYPLLVSYLITLLIQYYHHSNSMIHIHVEIIKTIDLAFMIYSYNDLALIICLHFFHNPKG